MVVPTVHFASAVAHSDIALTRNFIHELLTGKSFVHFLELKHLGCLNIVALCVVVLFVEHHFMRCFVIAMHQLFDKAHYGFRSVISQETFVLVSIEPCSVFLGLCGENWLVHTPHAALVLQCIDKPDTKVLRLVKLLTFEELCAQIHFLSIYKWADTSRCSVALSTNHSFRLEINRKAFWRLLCGQNIN